MDIEMFHGNNEKFKNAEAIAKAGVSRMVDLLLFKYEVRRYLMETGWHRATEMVQSQARWIILVPLH